MNFFQRFFKKKVKEDPEFPSRANKLPATLPPDLEIEISSGGTFVMSSERISINRTSLVSRKSYYQHGAEFKCEVSPTLIEGLFQVLQKNKFDKIKIIEEIRLDYPSNHVHLSWGNSFLSKGESQTEVIDKSWDHTYMVCRFALLDEIRKGMKDQFKKIKVKLTAEILNMNDRFALSCSDSISQYYYRNYFLADDLITKERSDPPEEIAFIPTYSELKIRFEKNGGKEVEHKFVLPEGEYDTICFYEENNELRWKLS